MEIFESSYKTNIHNKPSQEDIAKCIDQNKQPTHTLEAVKLMEHELKRILGDMVKTLFGPKVEVRWVDSQFPFTQPSFEMEIYHKGKWIEVLGCGIMRDEILQSAGVTNSIGYAFGMGIERLAMVLFDIPDIRLFWSRDSGFLSQFNERLPLHKIKYKPVSVYPQCSNDMSFWLPAETTIENFETNVNDFNDLVRDIGGDIVEQVSHHKTNFLLQVLTNFLNIPQVTLIDKFKHQKTGKSSLCFRIVYRHMERTLTQEEVNEIHKKIEQQAETRFNVKIR